MQYYCAYCNRLEKIESLSEEDDVVCNQCGRALTVLREFAKPESSALRRFGLVVLIGVTGSLLVLLWSWGGEPPGEPVYWFDLLAPFIWIIGIGVKLGLSVVIVSFALLIGTTIYPLKHRTSVSKPGMKRPLPTKAARTGVRITSIGGMVLGIVIIVLVIGGAISFVWQFIEMILGLPLVLAFSVQ